MAFGLEKVASINGERYVYYNRLLDEGYVQLYKKAYNETFLPRIEAGSDPQAIANYFLKLRNAEYTKECMLLSTQFGVNISGKYSLENSDPEMVGQQLIHAFNNLFNIKEVFNYHLGLIKETKGQKGVITYFHSYFNKHWNAARKALYDQISADIQSTCGANISTILENHLNTIVTETLYEMYGVAKNQNGIEGTIYDIEKPYQALAQVLEKHDPVADEFIQGMIKNYRLDEFVTELSNNIQQANSLSRTEFSKLSKQSLSLNFPKAGISKEFEGVLIAKINEYLAKAGGKTHHTGDANAKPDWVFTFGIDEDIIADAYTETMVGGGRKETVAKAKELKERLHSEDKGFIVYTSAKDYTLNSSFASRGGMQAEKNVSLQTWENILTTMNLASKDIVFSIMQTIPGAIGQDNLDHVSTMMARAIAGALFDDFDVSGSVPKSGAQAIHLLHLNGIYIPLSFYYDKLYKAFEYVGSAPELVRVDIKTPQMILFPTKEDQTAWKEQNPGMSPWVYQRDKALQEIQLSYHFFANFKKAMEDVNIIL